MEQWEPFLVAEGLQTWTVTLEMCVVFPLGEWSVFTSRTSNETARLIPKELYTPFQSHLLNHVYCWYINNNEDSKME